MRLAKYLKNQPKSFLITLGIFLFLVIGFLDFLISPEISIAVFYLIPVSIITWFGGMGYGILLSILSATVFLFANETIRYSSLNPAIPYWNAFVALVFFLTNTYLLCQLNKSLEREMQMARIDRTTGVANRRSFYELSNIELKRSLRYGHPFTVAYIDINDFKNIHKIAVNKSEAEILQTIAQTLREDVRETDIIARLGDDEFALFLPGVGYEPARIVIERVETNLRARMQENQLIVTFSIGAITFMNPPETMEEVIEKADYLMYRVKISGNNELEHIIEES